MKEFTEITLTLLFALMMTLYLLGSLRGRKDKEKMIYYKSFQEYKNDKKTIEMERVLYLALIESFHKRISYLRGEKIIRLSEYAKKTDETLNSLLNKAKRQTVSAFREKGVWKIGE